jgi:hypothetical protein
VNPTANPYDNAHRESVIQSLKREEIYPNEYQDIEHLRNQVAEFIERYHDRQRLHSALSCLLPDEFEVETRNKSQAELHSATVRYFAEDPQKVTVALLGEGIKIPFLPHPLPCLENQRDLHLDKDCQPG